MQTDSSVLIDTIFVSVYMSLAPLQSMYLCELNLVTAVAISVCDSAVSCKNSLRRNHHDAMISSKLPWWFEQAGGKGRKSQAFLKFLCPCSEEHVTNSSCRSQSAKKSKSDSHVISHQHSVYIRRSSLIESQVAKAWAFEKTRFLDNQSQMFPTNHLLANRCSVLHRCIFFDSSFVVVQTPTCFVHWTWRVKTQIHFVLKEMELLSLQLWLSHKIVQWDAWIQHNCTGEHQHFWWVQPLQFFRSTCVMNFRWDQARLPISLVKHKHLIASMTMPHFSAFKKLFMASYMQWPFFLSFLWHDLQIHEDLSLLALVAEKVLNKIFVNRDSILPVTYSADSQSHFRTSIRHKESTQRIRQSRHSFDQVKPCTTSKKLSDTW